MDTNDTDEASHRKKVRHYNHPGHAHMLTFSCYKRLALLKNDTWNTWLSQGIDPTLQKQNFRLIAFVYMPEHLHLLVSADQLEYRIENLLFAIKRPFSFKVKVALQESSNPLLNELTKGIGPTIPVFDSGKKALVMTAICYQWKTVSNPPSTFTTILFEEGCARRSMSGDGPVGSIIIGQMNTALTRRFPGSMDTLVRSLGASCD